MESVGPGFFARAAMLSLPALALPFLLALPLGAAPAWKSGLTSPAKGPLPNPPTSSIELELSWKGMLRAGIVRIDFAPADARKAGVYAVRSTSRSLGAAAVLFAYQSDFWSELNPADLRPIFTHAVETDSKERTVTDVRHFAKRSESVEILTTLKTGAVKKTARTFAEPAVFDIFSAMLHVRSQPLVNGDRIQILVFPFTTPYLLKVSVLGREIHAGRKAIRLSAELNKIDRKTMELKAYKKLKKPMTLWLSDDAERMPLEIRAAAFIGDVRATRIIR